MEIAIKIFQTFEKLGRTIVDAVLRPFHKSISDEQWNAFMQFVKFGLVGVTNTGITYVVYALFITLHVPVLVSYTIGYIVGILNAFYWNNKYVFHEENKQRNLWKALAKCFTSYIGSYVVSSILLLVWTDVLHISSYIAPIITLLITIPLNFLMNKFWAFRTEKKDSV